MQESPQKKTALDFEMFNTKYYWSICWAGVVEADENLNPTATLSRIVNPGVREKFIGRSMTLPFTSRELTRYPTFDKVAREIFTPLQGALVIGHALENDLKMIADVCRKFGLTPPDFDYIDTNVCYNACRNQFTEHSLGKLCEEFGIEFEAHDPSEDARASLAVIRRLSERSDSLEAFLAETGIVKGRFAGGLIRRTYYAAMPEKQRERLNRYNRIFDAAEKLGQGPGKSYYFANAVALETDLTAVAEGLLKEGARLTVDSYTADFTVTNDLTLGKSEYRILPLKTVVARLGLDAADYDYMPKKVTDADGKAISLTEYYSLKFRGCRGEGALSGETLCFCRAVERRADYDEIFRRVLSAGGSVTPRMESGITFVVNKLSDLRTDRTDGRIIAFLKSGGANKKVLTLAQLLTKA